MNPKEQEALYAKLWEDYYRQSAYSDEEYLTISALADLAEEMGKHQDHIMLLDFLRSRDYTRALRKEEKKAP
jgi:hypothetical protein